MKGVIKLGNIFGIKIEVHWTFFLLLLWVAILEVRQGSNLYRILFNEALILVLFLCVVLHELGHALMAKRFKIETQKIMLLPIGGVATLEKMPDKPIQELLVTLAGPAVNIIIALFLLLVVPLRNTFNFKAIVLEEILYTVSFESFLFYIFIANVMLVLFNLIPAFPMDGGRVLRAILSFKMSRLEATRIASGIGQGMAILFFVLGLFVNPFLILIAMFIFFGAYGENEMVKQQALLMGHTAEEAMLTDITILHSEDTIQKAIDKLLAGSEKDFVVMDNHQIMGILYHKDIIRNAVNPAISIKSVMNRDFSTVNSSTEITTVLERMAKDKTNYYPVTSNNELIGAIDLNNISEFILIKNKNRTLN